MLKYSKKYTEWSLLSKAGMFYSLAVSTLNLLTFPWNLNKNLFHSISLLSVFIQLSAAVYCLTFYLLYWKCFRSHTHTQQTNTNLYKSWALQFMFNAEMHSNPFLLPCFTFSTNQLRSTYHSFSHQRCKYRRQGRNTRTEESKQQAFNEMRHHHLGFFILKLCH